MKTTPEPAEGGIRKSRFREYAEAFGVALVIALIVRTLVIQAFKIPSSSMENTLLIGDHIFVNKFLYGYHIPFTKGRVLQFSTPKRGDIIVFVYPEDRSKDFIKRVIGLPGETVEIRNKRVLIDGKQLEEGYVRYVDGLSEERMIPARDSHPPVKVPPDKLFVMGDNRDRSSDSRFWGFVDMDAVIGKAVIIYFSIDWSRGVQWAEVWRYPEVVRWNRIGHLLH
ncbi:MAG: signal peptidase I [Desulfomonile tiedjei]|nr:signal peptidase I [Desulfomonile tiedjei]